MVSQQDYKLIYCKKMERTKNMTVYLYTLYVLTTSPLMSRICLWDPLPVSVLDVCLKHVNIYTSALWVAPIGKYLARTTVDCLLHGKHFPWSILDNYPVSPGASGFLYGFKLTKNQLQNARLFHWVNFKVTKMSRLRNWSKSII